MAFTNYVPSTLDLIMLASNSWAAYRVAVVTDQPSEDVHRLKVAAAVAKSAVLERLDSLAVI